MAQKVNTGVFWDERIVEALDHAAEETRKRNRITKKRRWGRSQQSEAMLARALGISLGVEPVFPSVKPSQK